MKLQALCLPSILPKALAALAIAGFLFLGSAPAAKANDCDDSNRRVKYTEMRYREAVRRFSPYSREAQHWARERHEAFERLEHCRRDWR